MAGDDDAFGEVEDSVLWSNAAVAQLEATVNMNEFCRRARKLGLVIKHRDSDGRWRNRSRAGIVKIYRQQLPVGGDRLGYGSRRHASLGFVVRPGPALPPVEDPPPAPSSPGTRPRSLRLSRSSKREREMQKIKKQKKRKGRMRSPGEKLKDKVRKRRPENKEADKRRHETAEAKRLQRERQKTDEYRAGAATRLARSRGIAAKKAAEKAARVRRRHLAAGFAGHCRH